MSLPSLSNWVKVYEKHGPQGLEGASLRPEAKKRGRKGLPASVRTEILAVKQENPEAGYRGVRNLLWRFRGVKVSPNTVGRTLREAEIAPVPPRRKKRRTRKKSKVQRFERALPMQLWQTDITSLVLTRHSQRVYLTVFLDDHSRYVVSWALALQQTKEFVMETLLSGISRFGKPEEVLTDQGRQYFSWRGKSDFRKLLRKQGIKHVVSRAHHPETVGKCERFWETVKAEFWDRVEPQELMDARERFDHFVKHYNHFRPHQGLDGLTPADRFFGAETSVRRVIEETISKNELKLAVGETPRKPVFLIGQIGDTPVSLHGEKGQLLLQTPDGLTKRLDYEDFGHGKEQPTAKPNEGEKAYDEGANEGHEHGTPSKVTSYQIFHLNALSSPILIKIHFDVVLTMIADTMYYHIAQSLKGFESCEAKKIFRHFIDMPAKILVTKDEILVRYPLRAHSPVLRSAGLDKWTPLISWLGDRKIRYQWGDGNDKP